MNEKNNNNYFYDKIPLYCKLAEEIEEKINSGIWENGYMIPSERELEKIYQVSRITVRKAVDELVKKGKLEAQQGKGTFVANKSIIQNLDNVYAFSKEMKKQGKICSTILVSKEIVKADDKFANRLGISAGDDIIYIERLRCSENQKPIMVEKTYFSLKKYPFVMEIDLSRDSLYKSLEEKYGIQINKAIETFKACELNQMECKQLNCKKMQYGLLIKRTSFFRDQLVCYSTIVSKGDIFEFTVQLES